MGITDTARATVSRAMPIVESARIPIIQPARLQLSTAPPACALWGARRSAGSADAAPLGCSWFIDPHGVGQGRRNRQAVGKPLGVSPVGRLKDRDAFGAFALGESIVDVVGVKKPMPEWWCSVLYQGKKSDSARGRVRRSQSGRGNQGGTSWS